MFNRFVMTHLSNLETLQFATETKENDTGVSQLSLPLLNFCGQNAGVHLLLFF